MRIQKITIENFRGIKKASVNFDMGFNVFVGANSSGKTTIVRALNWLLNPFQAQIINTSIPYSWQNHGEGNIRVEAEFILEDEDVAEAAGLLGSQRQPHFDPQILNGMIVMYTKTALVRRGNVGNIQQNASFKETRNALQNTLLGWLTQKLQSTTVLYFTDFERTIDQINNPFQPASFIPTSQVNSMNINQPFQMMLYLKSIILKLQDEEPEKFQDLKKKILESQKFIKDFDVAFNIKTGRADIYVKYINDDFPRPLENEGLGFQEYIYLLSIIMLFPNKTILMDEGLIHMHRTLLKEFVSSIGDMRHQLILTSHIRELVQILDYSGLIYCSNTAGLVEVRNFTDLEDLQSAYRELGYTDDRSTQR